MNSKRLGTALFTMLLLWLVACSGGSGPAFSPPLPGDRVTSDSSSAVAGATAIFNIVVPAHPPLLHAPKFVSPATQGVGITVRTSGSSKSTRIFLALSTTESYCSGGGITAALTCHISARVPAGKDSFTVNAYDGKNTDSAILATATFVHNVRAGSQKTIGLSMGGVVRYLLLAVDDPYAPRGASATIPVTLVAADAYAYPIVGDYDKPIAITDSDKSGATKLSSASIANSTEASHLALVYDGAKLKKPATIAATTADALVAPQTATDTFDPGAPGIVANPVLPLVTAQESTDVLLGGPGTRAPFVFSTAGNAKTIDSCRGIVAVDVNGSSFSLHGTRLGACRLAAFDSAGHTRSVSVLVSMPDATTIATPTPGATPTPQATATPQATPTPTATATPAPTPEPGAISVKPNAVTLCPRSGSNACDNNTATVTVTQTNFAGSFVESDDCASGVASVTTASASGPSAAFTISGISKIGTCRAIFTGGAGKQTGVAIIISPPGVVINSQHH